VHAKKLRFIYFEVNVRNFMKERISSIWNISWKQQPVDQTLYYYPTTGLPRALTSLFRKQ